MASISATPTCLHDTPYIVTVHVMLLEGFYAIIMYVNILYHLLGTAKYVG